MRELSIRNGELSNCSSLIQLQSSMIKILSCLSLNELESSVIEIESSLIIRELFNSISALSNYTKLYRELFN